MLKIRTIETSGWSSALQALRLPYNKKALSKIDMAQTAGERRVGEEEWHKALSQEMDIVFDPKDIGLMQTLIKRGDEHAKPMRIILAYAMVSAPLDFWHELETYIQGHQRGFSSSTMHTEGRALSGHALREALHQLPIDHMFTKCDYWSYQTLRRIVEQRYDHRKECWHEFIEWIKTLPLAKELIFVGLDDKIAIHDEWMRKYKNNEI